MPNKIYKMPYKKWTFTNNNSNQIKLLLNKLKFWMKISNKNDCFMSKKLTQWRKIWYLKIWKLSLYKMRSMIWKRAWLKKGTSCRKTQVYKWVVSELLSQNEKERWSSSGFKYIRRVLKIQIFRFWNERDMLFYRFLINILKFYLYFMGCSFHDWYNKCTKYK